MQSSVHSAGGANMRNVHVMASTKHVSHFEPLYHKIKLIFLTLLSTLKFE